ncbi:MAG: tetratricopeptide repeat protein [Tildeniella nuda ZEHNDER 1965/U140]|jgi:tetratricopeptide (TPR) repeat protein|nr:tetratricopeptide repeat protein [Tildeniella nuda ZEHNDER 1965/U140]
MDAKAKTDFFVSYNQNDRAFAEWIAWILESEGYTTIIQAWDFGAGGNFVLEMQTAAAEAERTIAVLSNHSLRSGFVQAEWAAAFAKDATGKARRLIPIRVADCTPQGLWAQILYVDLVGKPEDIATELVRQEAKKAVKKERGKPTQKPIYPDSTPHTKPIYPPSILQNLPYGSTNFVGRETELAQIHEQLQRGSTVAISAISGMGGIGKTELALQYARQHCRESDYPGGLCWIRAREDVGTQIISFVRSCLELIPPDDLELIEKVRWCWRRWREGAALLIFDDVQEYDDIAPFLPPQDSRFKVLLTTRSHFGSPVQDIQLEVLSEAKALELLRAIVSQGRDTTDPRLLQEVGDLERQLCEWLGYLPLGVELVGRYLARKPDLSLAVLWQRLQDKRLDAIAFKQAEPGMTASLGVAAAFELSWQALDESAQQVAAVLSLFALVEIPWTLVEQCLPTLDAEELEEIRDEQLLGTHLLKRVDQGMYQLHQLLREFFAAKRSQRADDSALQQRFYEGVIAEAERVQEKPERSLTKESTIMISHLQAAMERLARPEQALDLATCLHWTASLYHGQGRYVEAEPLYVRSLSIREQQLGNDHLDVATSLNGLATLYQAKGRYAEAEPLFARSLLIRQRQLGDDHPDVATSLNNLAHLYYFQGRYGEAEPLFMRSLEIQQRQLGDDHLDVAQNLNDLAVLYSSQGRYGEAEPLFMRSLEIQQRQLGDNHLDVARNLNDLAILYNSQGRYGEAEPLYVRSLEIQQWQLGDDHLYVTSSLNNLAFLYYSQGRYREAEPLYLRSLSIRQCQLGDDHPGVATSLNNLAALYRLQERYTEAESFFLKAISIRQKQLPADHPHLARSLHNLAGVYDQQRRYREAERLYLQALPIFLTKLEANHPWVQEGTQNFRALLQKAIQEQRSDELSDDVMTRGVLRVLEEGYGVWGVGEGDRVGREGDRNDAIAPFQRK